MKFYVLDIRADEETFPYAGWSDAVFFSKSEAIKAAKAAIRDDEDWERFEKEARVILHRIPRINQDVLSLLLNRYDGNHHLGWPDWAWECSIVWSRL
jgi:hypothetical protein